MGKRTIANRTESQRLESLDAELDRLIEHEGYVAQLQEENRRPRPVDVEGLMRSSKLADPAQAEQEG